MNPENTNVESTAVGEINAAPATVYEIMNKVTGETFPVSHDGSGDLDNDQDADFFCKKEDGTEVVFKREGSTPEGNAVFTNEEYSIRSVDTHMALDGVTPVEDVVPTPPTPSENVSSDATAVVKFNVLDGAGNFVRTYEESIHGPEAKALAEQYAASIGGSVQ